MIRFSRNPLGVRCFILGRRLHHGRTGLILAALGALLMLHDRRDFPWPGSP